MPICQYVILNQCQYVIFELMKEPTSTCVLLGKEPGSDSLYFFSFVILDFLKGPSFLDFSRAPKFSAVSFAPFQFSLTVSLTICKGMLQHFQLLEDIRNDLD